MNKVYLEFEYRSTVNRVRGGFAAWEDALAYVKAHLKDFQKSCYDEPLEAVHALVEEEENFK
jgi:hypothetical protein